MGPKPPGPLAEGLLGHFETLLQGLQSPEPLIEGSWVPLGTCLGPLDPISSYKEFKVPFRLKFHRTVHPQTWLSPFPTPVHTPAPGHMNSNKLNQMILWLDMTYFYINP